MARARERASARARLEILATPGYASVMGTLRRTAAAVVSTTALVGCALISGASDLTVGPSDGDSAAPTSASQLDGASDADGGPIGLGPDGSNAPTDGAVVDGRPPFDGGDGGGRLRDVTFEDGTVLGLHGGDSSFGNANITSFNALAGGHSLRIDKSPSGIEVDVPAQNELFVTALVRLESFNGSESTLLGIVPEPGGTVAEVRVQAGPAGGAMQVTLVVGGNVVAAGGMVAVGTVYRVGFHVQQDATTHLIEIFMAAAGGAFGAPIIQSTTAVVGRSTGIRMGVLDTTGVNNTKSTFDNLFIDTLAMPPP